MKIGIPPDLVQHNQTSRTAEYMALFRAMESARSPSRRLFHDPFARAFLRPSLRIIRNLATIPVLGAFIPWMIDTRWPGARSSGVARTRLVDDLLIRALQNGVEQVVILGAGFDCRAYRLAGIDRVRVIEVDHPDTQQAKCRNLRHVLGNLPNHVRFIPLDFNRQGLEEIASASGFDGNRSTFYLWEGVTNYLTASAVEATFRAMRRLSRNSQVLFTYVDRAVLDPEISFPGKDRLRKTLQSAGEVWTFGFNPADLKDYLDRRGFRLVDDIGSVEYRSRYLGTHPRLLRGYEFYRVAMGISQ